MGGCYGNSAGTAMIQTLTLDGYGQLAAIVTPEQYITICPISPISAGSSVTGSTTVTIDWGEARSNLAWLDAEIMRYRTKLS